MDVCTQLSESSALLLFPFQNSYASFRCVVMRWDSWVFEKVEHIFFGLAKAVSDVSEQLFELVEILTEQLVKTLKSRGSMGDRVRIFISPVDLFPHQLL